MKNAILFCAALTAATILASETAERLKADTPEKPLTLGELASAPRRPTTKVAVPDDTGVYIGSGVYKHQGQMLMGGFCFTYWAPPTPTYDQVLEMCVNEGVGNTLQFWQSNDLLLDLARKAKAKGLYATCIYSDATNGIPKKVMSELGPSWIGYDFGERFVFGIYDDWTGRGKTLTALAENYMNRVHRHVANLHAAGWGDVMATSGNFSLDYEVAAGVEIPCTEDASCDFVLFSALDRGLYRQYGLPMWGSHIAHEWYSWIPHRNPYKMRSLETAFYVKYMTGAKLILNESGNWQLQSNLCEDSPMSQMPITARKISTKLDAEGRAKYEAPVMDEAKRKWAYIDQRSPVAVKYRRIIADFTKFCKAHPAPKGQPEATWALAKGNLDLGSPYHVANAAICGAYDLAEKNPNWMSGLPEQSWETVRKAVMPLPPMFRPNKNIMFSGTPYGLCDIASFACDRVTSEYLLRNYKVLMFSGWNTCSPKQYRTLCDYVKGGGKLVIGLCHLSTNDTRDFTNPKVEELVNGGDFTELCGFKVKGKTPRRYWATGPSTTPNCLGFVARRRFGYMELPLGQLEYVAPAENFENLAVDDEEDDPFVIRCKNGKGEVFFMNWWGYPAAANMDVGPGAEEDEVGMVGYLYRYCAKLGRGNVWITGPDFENPDEDCRWIVCSYFPDEGKVYLLNLDYERERKCVLQQFGDKDLVTLNPGEFRIVDSVKLDPDEKLNFE